MKHSIFHKIIYFQLVVLLPMLFMPQLSALEPVKVAPEHEKRYHYLLSELRCLVCQNQTIAESNSELANDLRAEVNKMLIKGASDSEIIGFMANRYGDFILYKPLVKPKTYMLWFGPFIFLIMILFLVFFFLRKQKPSAEVGLSTDEKEKLDSILKETKE